MTKKKHNQKRTWNYIVAGIMAFIIIVLSSFFYLISPKHPPLDYYVKVMDKIGAPEGFTQNDNVIRNNFFEPIEVRRKYNGPGTFEAMHDEMILRLRNVGFSNATWRPKADNQAAGIVAGCKDVSIFVRVYQEGNDPIDIAVNETNNSASPTCPEL